ncbi:TPA: right-handed parallel beta-helix repeat-containing protein [Thermoplasmata archaeon]|nr:right-handed parallel beta-helix repeat-containing protein [Thermoplasmata archaeon]
MTRWAGHHLLVLLLVQVLAIALFVPTDPVRAQVVEIIVPADEHWTWEDGSRNISEKVTVQGTLTVRNYELRFNLTNDGEASFWVDPGGVLEFDNVTMAPDNGSALFYFKVSGRFDCRDSHIAHLTGQFATGGGIKCVDGEVEMNNTRITDCKVQGVYVDGPQAKVVLDNCIIDDVEYGVHVLRGGTATLRNGSTIDGFSRAGVLINTGEAHLSNSTLVASSDKRNHTLSQGVAARNAQITVFDSVIRDCAEDGIELTDESSAHMINTEVGECKVGVRMTSSSAEIVEGRIHDCVDGMNILLSDPKVRRSHLVDNTNGVASKDCAPGYLLEDCTIGGNAQYGIYAVGEGLRETGTKWTSDGGAPNTLGRLLQMWKLDVNVTDRAAIPVSGAVVEVKTGDGDLVFNSTTDALGQVRDIELEGWLVASDGTNVTQKPYQVRIEKGDRWAEKSVTMDTNKALIVGLGEAPSITDSPFFWAVPVIIVILVVVAIAYWWFYVR